jgi:hypothetical protein
MAWEMMKLIIVPLFALLLIPASCFTLEKNRNNTPPPPPPPCPTKNKENFEIDEQVNYNNSSHTCILSGIKKKSVQNKGGVYINIYLIKQRFETCSCHCHYPQETFVSLDDTDDTGINKGKSSSGLLDVKLNMSLEDKEKRGEWLAAKISMFSNKYSFQLMQVLHFAIHQS